MNLEDNFEILNVSYYHRIYILKSEITFRKKIGKSI